MSSGSRSKKGLSIREIVIFAMLGTIMFVSKLLMEGLPNIHLLGTLIVTYTLVYRWKALFPIYVYAFLELFEGAGMWWVPNLYIWTVLWGVTMLLPRRMPKWLAPVVYCVVSGLHGLSYGTLFAPWQALAFHMSFRTTLAWIASGFPFDVIHCIGNLCLGVLIIPLSTLLRRLDKKAAR